MPSLAITGSLGSGKSHLLRQLVHSLQGRGLAAVAYSADEENRRLLEENREVRAEIASRLGNECLNAAGDPDKEKLRQLVQTSPDARETLESIMHPRLRSTWLPLAEKHRGTISSFFVAEIPLLYEKGLERHFDRVLGIGCSEAIRKERLQTSRHLHEKEADRWLAIQQSQVSKNALADHLIWNDGPPDSLNRQITHFLRYLNIP
jgi:dephospho-CoA kinase